ncbi:cytochrome P450 736A117-like [Cornus florida]|uniref:cytochrome P450 736A117-like n=1 Tax=Cornus florida TaxID=4283 RepID=UPI00289DF922|nr:cytochrome P450 736A117-like [Cornus florida]
MEQQPVTSFFFHPFFFPSLPILFIAFLIKKWLLNTSTINKHLPPSPPKLPIIGNFHQLGSLSHHPLRSLAQRYGPLMLLHLGSTPTLVVSSADAAREIMKTHDIVFSNRPKSIIAKRLLYDYKDVSVAPYGEFWRQMKSIFVLQLLSNRRVQSFHFVREEETALLMKKIEESSSLSSALNLREMFSLLTNDVVCRTAFGRKYSGGESGKKFMRLLTDFLALLGSLDIGNFIPWLAWINHVNGLYAKVDRVGKEIDEFLEQVVEERMNVPKTKSNGDETVEDEDGREDFLDILLRIHKENSAVDRDCIKALILDAFSAGTDTTSTVLEWAMTELLRHPRVMNKVKNEVREILKGKPHITADDLEEMHYLKAVIKETVRLHPPIPLLVPHEASEDVRVMGYDIAAGTMVLINAWAIGTDPMTWVEPEEFQPERFLNSSIDFRGHDFELIPFGAGRRGCPGTSFAIATNEFVLANLVHKFDWALPGGAKGENLDMTECPGATIRRRIPLLAVATPCSC